MTDIDDDLTIDGAALAARLIAAHKTAAADKFAVPETVENRPRWQPAVPMPLTVQPVATQRRSFGIVAAAFAAGTAIGSVIGFGIGIGWPT